VTGYGDQRPIQSNGSVEGKAQNRRVEVMILPNTVRSTVAGGGTRSSSPRNTQKPAVNKDGTISPVDSRPAFNK